MSNELDVQNEREENTHTHTWCPNIEHNKDKTHTLIHELNPIKILIVKITSAAKTVQESNDLLARYPSISVRTIRYIPTFHVVCVRLNSSVFKCTSYSESSTSYPCFQSPFAFHSVKSKTSRVAWRVWIAGSRY